MWSPLNYLSKQTKTWLPFGINRTTSDKYWSPLLKEYEEPPQYVNVGKNELLLGYEPWDDNYETAVTIPFDPSKRRTFIITGDNDSGKSVFSQFLMGQLRYRFGRYIAMIDPKDDSYNMQKPNIKSSLIEILNHYRIKPQAHPLIRIYPKFSKMLGVDGVAWAPSLKDFKGLDTTTEISRLAKFFELEKKDPSLRIVTMFITSEEKKYRTVECPIKYAHKDYEKCDKFKKINDKEFAPCPKRDVCLLYEINKIKEKGIGTRTEKLEEGIMLKVLAEQLQDDSVDIPELLATYGMIVLKVPVVKEEIDVTDAFASLFISSIMTAREKYLISGKGEINRPVSIVCDEADKYAGTNTITNSLLTQITTKFRSIRNQAGLDSLLITQHPSYLDSTQVLEADYIFGVRLNMQEDIDLLRQRAGVKIYDMEECEFIIGKHPKVFWVLDKNGGVKFFKPLPAPNFVK